MANAWTPERRAQQSAAIRRWQPWLQSTGPRTAEGKARVARNGYKGGKREEARTLAKLFRQLRYLDYGADPWEVFETMQRIIDAESRAKPQES